MLAAVLVGSLVGGAAQVSLALITDRDGVAGNVFTTASSFGLQPASNLALAASCHASTIAVRGATSATGSGTLSLTRPAGVVQGDVLVAQVTARTGGSTMSAPAGWTLVRNDSAGIQVQSAVFVRAATGSEPTSYAFGTSSGARMAGGMSAYSGVSTTAPVEVHGAATGSGTSMSAPSVTTASANTLLLALWTSRQQAASSTPASMTQRWNVLSGGCAGSVGATAADASFAGPGATGVRTATAASAFDWIGQSIALRAATTPRITANWTATPSTEAEGYKLQRWLGTTLQSEWSVTPRTATQYIDASAVSSTSYSYRLRAFTSTAESTAVSGSVTSGACAP